LFVAAASMREKAAQKILSRQKHASPALPKKHAKTLARSARHFF